MSLYGQTIDELVPVSSSRVAEAAKPLQNIFRMGSCPSCENEAVSVHAVYPGPGLGGHCIPIDSFFYLRWKAREYGKHTRFIEPAIACDEHFISSGKVLLE
jgi:UDP-N-acetyl-D-glucosamine dehydrogenase